MIGRSIEGLRYESLAGEPTVHTVKIEVRQLGIGKFVPVRRKK